MNTNHFSFSVGILISSFLFSFTCFGQSGYQIELTITDYNEEKIFLAEQYGANQYIIDSALVTASGKFILENEKALPTGAYSIVLLPDNNVIQFLADEDNQNFSLNTNSEFPVSTMKIEGSPLNINYYKYLQFLGEQQMAAQLLQEEIDKAKKNNNQNTLAAKRATYRLLDEQVEQVQIKTIAENKGSILGQMLKANLPLDIPDFSNEEYPRYSEFVFTKAHWFDHIDLQDPRMLRISILDEKIETYLNKLTVPEADSINSSIDYILGRFDSAPASFEYYLIHFLNKYASAPQIGLDKVYVHLADKYFATGKGKFADEKQVKKIVKEANDMRATLLGEIAPNIALQEIDVAGTLKVKNKKDEKKRWVTKGNFSLHDIQAAYTILFLWSPTCDHCKKSMPAVKSFYEKYKNKGIELVAICNQNYKGMPLCAEFIKDNQIGGWINAVDPYLKSRYKQLYNVRTYPQVFILGKDKKILMKQFEPDQLGFVMEKILAGEL